MKDIFENLKVQLALKQIENDSNRTLEEQMELCAIASPVGMEQARGKRFAEMFVEAGLDEVHIDEADNVFGIINGSENESIIMISAHMDTVFPDGTDCTPRIENGIVYAPGIADDTRGMAEILELARVIKQYDITPKSKIIFCGTAGEEGGMIGMNSFFEKNPKIDMFISIDAAISNKLSCDALGGYNYQISYLGEGGHASHLFGYPNANNALGRAIAKIADVVPPNAEGTIFNIGIVNGGVATNCIPTSSSMQIDIRSSDNTALNELRDTILDLCRQACEEENLRWKHPTQKVSIQIEKTKSRLAYRQSHEIPMIKAAVQAYEMFGFTPIVPPGSSTDADVPMRRGIPSITLGRGGSCKHTHTLNEQYDPSDGYIAVQRDLVFLLFLSEIYQ